MVPLPCGRREEGSTTQMFLGNKDEKKTPLQENKVDLSDLTNWTRSGPSFLWQFCLGGGGVWVSGCMDEWVCGCLGVSITVCLCLYASVSVSCLSLCL